MDQLNGLGGNEWQRCHEFRGGGGWVQFDRLQ